jgi:hypothetical protein
MAEPQPITFDDAIADTAGRVRHLLLGNGFSISARRSFSYSSLAGEARPGFSPAVEALFRGTDDFEQVLALLRERLADDQAAPEDRQAWKEQENEVRTAFIDVLQRVHPEHSLKVDDLEKERCASFLEHFVGRDRGLKLAGRVYTTNYDLLLYWVVASFGRRLWCYDSHINPDPYSRKPYGLWNSNKPPELLYLHGALHLYDIAPNGQGMLRYSGKHSLIEQARKRLARGSFPTIVSEGTTEAKTTRIARSAYLSWASGFLRRGLRNPQAVLFTYGHSLDKRDAHLIRQIGRGRISAVYVGAWEGMAGSDAENIRHWVRCWQEARSSSDPLTVYVYDTSQVSPWTYSQTQGM